MSEGKATHALQALHSMPADIKYTFDTVGVGITIGAVFDYLPEATALLTFLWLLIRIYETNTVQKLFGKS